ncbi:MAG: hypothetical protein QOI66_51 [Myxococcales bacterium]|jgi:hypothetical protein|nr:hypothetical protein [Myxococcales bacterium]
MASKGAKKTSKTAKPSKPAKAPPTKAPPAKDRATKASAPKPAKPEKPAKPAKVAFPKKNQAPSETEFAARLPMAAGKRFEMVRAFLKKQKGVAEELFFYGPKTGWAYRYVRDGQQSVCSMMIHQDRLLGIVALDPAAMAGVDWPALSPVAQKAKRLAHGSPVLQWIDVPLEGTGAADFRALLKAKLKALPIMPPPTPPARASGI